MKSVNAGGTATTTTSPCSSFIHEAEYFQNGGTFSEISTSYKNMLFWCPSATENQQWRNLIEVQYTPVKSIEQPKEWRSIDLIVETDLYCGDWTWNYSDWNLKRSRLKLQNDSDWTRDNSDWTVKRVRLNWNGSGWTWNNSDLNLKRFRLSLKTIPTVFRWFSDWNVKRFRLTSLWQIDTWGFATI